MTQLMRRSGTSRPHTEQYSALLQVVQLTCCHVQLILLQVSYIAYMPLLQRFKLFMSAGCVRHASSYVHSVGRGF